MYEGPNLYGQEKAHLSNAKCPVIKVYFAKEMSGSKKYGSGSMKYISGSKEWQQDFPNLTPSI